MAEEAHDGSEIGRVPGSSAWTSSSSDPYLTMAEASHPWIREVGAGGIVIINKGHLGDIIIGVAGDVIKDVHGNIIKDTHGNIIIKDTHGNIIIKKEEKGANYVAPRVAEIPRRSVNSQGVNTDFSKNLVFFRNAVEVFDLDDLFKASAEVLGKGTFGIAYKATLEMGVAVAVKRLKKVPVSEKEFKEKMEEIGNMDHVNLVPLRAYYYSRDEKLLISDYMPMGSLSALLHRNRGSGRTPLNWETRSGIAVGAARAITYLHSHGPTISHGNIKSSNILLTSSYEARVSHICLAHFASPSSTPNRISGYRAPEVTDSNKVTQNADIYSFGVLLLELLTGKPPTQALMNEEGVDLPRWVNSVVPEEWTVEVFDLELLRYQNVEDKIIQLLKIALKCIVQCPDKRPSMAEVTSQIEAL